jgi:PAS domain S-box-containing protein
VSDADPVRSAAVFDSAAVGISVTDEASRMLAVNEAFAAMVGYESRELVGRSFGDITHPDDRGLNLELYAQLVAGERDSFRLEKRYIRRDGRVVWGRVNVSLGRRHRGEPIRVVTVIENVDDLKRAEERLRETEERYRTLVEQLPLVTYIDAADELASNIFTSPQIEAMLGYTAEEWQNDPDMFVNTLHPEDRDPMLERLRDTTTRFQPYVGEYRLVARDGRVVWVRDGAVPVFDEDGAPKQFQGYLLDITERKLAEEDARAAVARIGSIVDGALDAVISMDASGIITGWNANAETVFGWTADEAIGRLLADTIVPPPMREAHQRGIEEYLRTRMGRIVGQRIEVVAMRRDGTQFPVELAVTAVPFGDTVFFNAFVRDISERRAAEDALRAGEERYRTLIENIPGAVYRCSADEDWTMAFISDEIETITGYPASDYLGNAIRSFASVIHPDDAHGVSSVVEAGIREQRPYVCEYRLVRADGDVRWVHEKGQPVYGADGVTRWLDGAIFDITERKRAEEEQTRTQALLDTIVDHIPMALFVKDAQELRYVRVNRAHNELVGDTGPLGLRDHDFYPAEQADSFVAQDREVLAGGAPIEIGEETLITADGSERVIRTAKVPIRDEDGRPLYLLGISEDITQRKEAERERERLLAAEQVARAEAEAARSELAEQNLELRKLDHLKDEFVALVSHELRTPLTSIIGYLDLVLDEEGGPVTVDQRRFLDVIRRNSQRLLHLVGDLLFVAQVDAGKLSLEKLPVDLNELARDCLEAVRPRATEKGVVVELAADEVDGFEGDRLRLSQLFDNLVSNAIKFTPTGGRVDIAVTRRNGTAVVTVADTGIGIPEQEQARLFERFFRADGATRLAIQGTGLGLTISKAIAEAHGGTIGVESQEGVGTTFAVELPIGSGATS